MNGNRYLVTVSSVLLGAVLLLPSAALAQEENWKKAYQEFERKNYRQAETLFREVVEQYEEWGWGHLMLGIMLSELGRRREALDYLQTATELVSEDVERFQVNHAIGQIHLLEMRYDRAIAAENEASKYAQTSDERRVVANGGAWALGRKADDQILTAMDTTTSFVGTHSGAITRTLLLQSAETLDDNDVPNDGERWGLMTPWSA